MCGLARTAGCVQGTACARTSGLTDGEALVHLADAVADGLGVGLFRGPGAARHEPIAKKNMTVAGSEVRACERAGRVAAYQVSALGKEP